ncbi:MAG: acyl-CoA dehydrogenase family protein [Desulfobacterota bacterium]|nr:acyl-CoA dehydrogenase family protein [Thermodesulfobacteriota bacterium]
METQDRYTSLRQDVRRIVAEEVKHRAREIEESDQFPFDMANRFFEEGYLQLLIPKEMGGQQGDITSFCILAEEVAKVSASLSLLIIVQSVGTLPVLIASDDRQRRLLCSQIVKDRLIMAFCLTEPHAGSDVASLQMKATRQGEGYLLNGKKSFVTNGGIADRYVVFAKTDPSRGRRGISAFYIEKDRKGLSFSPKDDKIGMRGIPSCTITFRDVSIPSEHRIGQEGEGFKIAMETLNRSRPAIGAQALGIAESAMEVAVVFAMRRRQFGKPIAKLEGMQFMLAEMATLIESAKALVYKAAHHLDHGLPHATKYSAMCKYFASDVAMKIATDAVQILGGYGCLRNSNLERTMRDAKITQIYEGTNQVQRFVVAEQLIKEYLETYGTQRDWVEFF